MGEGGEIGLYADPAVYDILHARGTGAELEALERVAARYTRGARQAVWLEPACGTGRYVIAAARRGHRAVGFDRNGAMIEYARRRGRGLPVRFAVADMTGFARRVRRADFAFNPVNTIRHLPSDATMLAHLREMARVLRPGGVYAVGLTLTSYGMEFPSEDVWEGRRGGCHVRQIAQYIPPIGLEAERSRVEMVHSHLVVTRTGRQNERVEHRDSAYPLRCYSLGQWESIVRRAGFEVAALTGARGEEISASPSGYGVWVLRPRTATRSRRSD